MSFNAGAATSTLGLDISDFQTGMLGAQGMMQLFPSWVTNFMASPLLGFMDLAARAAGTLRSAFDTALNQADTVNDLSTAVGVSAEQLSGLGLVAGQAGSGLQAVGDAYKFLGRNAAEAAAGNKTAIETFTRLGIAPKDAAGSIRPLEELMLELADAMAAMPDGAQRTQAAMDLLGRSGTDLIPTLIQGSGAIREQMAQFEQYGAVVSGAAARSADAWGDAVGELNIAWSGLQNQFGQELRIALLPQLEELLNWVRTHPEEMRAIVQQTAGAVVSILLFLGDTAAAVAPHIDTLATLLGVGVLGLSLRSAFGLVNQLAGALGGLAQGFLSAGQAGTFAAGGIGRGLAIGAGVGTGVSALGGGSGASLGSGIGSGIGSILGSFFGPVGTLAGGFLGGLAGGAIGAAFDLNSVKQIDTDLAELGDTSEAIGPALQRLPSFFEEIDRRAGAAIPNIERVDLAMGSLVNRVAQGTSVGAGGATINRPINIDRVDVTVPPAEAGDLAYRIAERVQGPLSAKINDRIRAIEGAAQAQIVKENL